LLRCGGALWGVLLSLSPSVTVLGMSGDGMDQGPIGGAGRRAGASPGRSSPAAGHRRPTQKQRVLAVLRLRPGGVNETAFAAPTVIDGGLPVQRVAARVWELRQEGHEIVSRREADGTATYALRGVRAPQLATAIPTGDAA
jgi:hypothetical protein